MKESGFTLVEVIVVVVIISIISAVALPKYFDISNKAKASEMPYQMRTIMTAEIIYQGEEGHYADCPWVDANNDYLNDNLESILGINAVGSHFYYYTDIGAESFTVTAHTYNAIGPVRVGTEVTSDEDFQFSYAGDATAIAKLKKYCKSFLTD